MVPCAACERNSFRSHPELLQLILCVLDSGSANLRPPWLLRSLNGQFCATPGWAHILINEWVSLCDHCTVWELGLHHSHKFLTHLRKLKLDRSLVLFLQSKALIYFPHFYPNKFFNNSQIEEKCQISFLLNHSAKTIQSPTTERPRHLSAKPWYPLIFSQLSTPLPSSFPLGGQFPWHLSASPHPVSFACMGIYQYLSTEFHSVSRPWEGMLRMFHPPPTPTQYLSYGEVADNLLQHQKKLRISTNMGDSRTRRDLPKFVCTP